MCILHPNDWGSCYNTITWLAFDPLKYSLFSRSAMPAHLIIWNFDQSSETFRRPETTFTAPDTRKTFKLLIFFNLNVNKTKMYKMFLVKKPSDWFLLITESSGNMPDKLTQVLLQQTINTKLSFLTLSNYFHVFVYCSYSWRI